MSPGPGVRVPAWLLLLLAGLAGAQEAPRFEGAKNRDAPEGHLLLAWTAVADAASHYELQRAPSDAFDAPRVLYRGPDLGSFQSGLPEGTVWYRVRAVSPAGQPSGPWSEPLRVSVDYVALSRVFQLMALGTLVFLATAGAIVAGHRRRGGPAGSDPRP